MREIKPCPVCGWCGGTHEPTTTGNQTRTVSVPEPEDYYPDDDDDDKEPYSWDLCDLEAIGTIHDKAGDE